MADWLDLYQPEPAAPGSLAPYKPVDPAQPSILGVFGRSAARSALPTGAGVAAFPAGAAAGAALGLPLDPFTLGGASVVGAGIVGLGASFGAGYGAEKIQRGVADAATGGSYSLSEQQDEAAHPTAAFLGSVAPQIAFMRPGWSGLRPAIAGAAIGGGVQAAQDYAQTGAIDPLHVGAQALFGAFLGHNTRLGDAVQAPANSLVNSIAQGVGATAARAGANATVDDTLAAAPHAAPAATPPSPDLSPQTTADLSRVQALQAAIGDHQTPDEIAAGHVIEGDALHEATNPFAGSPAATAVHGQAVASTLDAMQTGAPLDPPPSFSGVARVAAKIDGAESRTDTDRNPLSSASGRGQFTDKTWKNLYRQHFGGDGMSDEQILALKTNGKISAAMTQALVGDNAALLLKAGEPVSDGNLYLLHFLGPHGLDVLRADPATPVAQLLPHDFLTSNPKILEGKSAGDVIAWADKKMGGAGAIARSAEPAGAAPNQPDPEIRSADAEMALDDAEDETSVGREVATGATLPPEEDADRLNGLLDTILPKGGTREQIINYKIDRLTRELDDLDTAPGAINPDDRAAVAAELADHQAILPAARLRDQGAEHARLTRAMLNDARDELSADVANKEISPEDAKAAVAAASKANNAADAIDIIDRRPRQRRGGAGQRAGPVDVNTFLADRGGIRDDEGHALGKFGEVGANGRQRSGRDLQKLIPGAGPLIRKSGMSIDAAGELLHEAGYFEGEERPSVADVLDLLERASHDKLYTVHEQPEMDARQAATIEQGRYDQAHDAVRDAAIARGLDLGDSDLHRAAELSLDGMDHDDAVTAASAEAANLAVGTIRESLAGFDDPDGALADQQLQSLEHDFQMELEDPHGDLGDYRIDEEGQPATLADILAQAEAEQNGADELRACMAPGATA